MLRKNPIETGEKCSVYKVNQLERCDVHRDGTCSVIKPTGLPSADDIWGINLTRRQLRDRALLGRLSCYHTDSGNGFHCWRDIRFPKQFHSEATLLQIHIGWHIRFCAELQKKYLTIILMSFGEVPVLTLIQSKSLILLWWTNGD